MFGNKKKGICKIFERALFKIKIKVKVATFKMSVGVLTIMVTLSKIKIGLYDRGRLFKIRVNFWVPIFSMRWPFYQFRSDFYSLTFG